MQQTGDLCRVHFTFCSMVAGTGSSLTMNLKWINISKRMGGSMDVSDPHPCCFEVCLGFFAVIVYMYEHYFGLCSFSSVFSQVHCGTESEHEIFVGLSRTLLLYWLIVLTMAGISHLSLSFFLFSFLFQDLFFIFFPSSVSKIV